jgi:hypothetical protein
MHWFSYTACIAILIFQEICLFCVAYRECFNPPFSCLMTDALTLLDICFQVPIKLQGQTLHQHIYSEVFSGSTSLSIIIKK